jgi:hypothetical protein
VYTKKSTNFDVLSELGRFPLHFNVITAMIRYYDRLKKIEEMFPLLHAAYKEYISIDDSNHASWFSSIKCAEILNIVKVLLCLKFLILSRYFSKPKFFFTVK